MHGSPGELVQFSALHSAEVCSGLRGREPCRDAHSAVVVALLAQLGWRPLSVKPEALVQSSPATCLRGEAKRSCLGVLPAGPRKRGSTLGLVAVACDTYDYDDGESDVAGEGN